MRPPIHPIHDVADREERCGGVVDANGLAAEIDAPSFRQRIVQMVSPSSYFDTFILAAIFLNSIAIACVDYRFVDENYQPSTELSVRNNIIEKAEILFTVVFAAECILKIIAYGFVRGKGAYLRDGWNALDFAIVIVSILGLVPGVPNLSVLRSFRVLRPLRSVSKLPSLRKVANAFVESMGDLANVMVLLLFILSCFTLFGVTFWRGLFHFRCRITPFPVKVSVDCRNATDPCWDQFLLDAVSDPNAHRCLPYTNDDVESWTQSTSPWFLSGPQDCVWPVDDADLRVCSDSSGPGTYTCSRSITFMELEVSRTCGSNYDAFGNPRFIDSLEPYGLPRMQASIFDEALNWGFANYDDTLHAFITTFQVITLEGWSDIMARVMDGWWTAPAVITFSALIVLGGIVALNIVLAVISSSLDKIVAREEEEAASATGENTKKVPSSDSAFQRKVQEIIRSRVYTRFVLATIVLNTVILSCDHYGISDSFQMILDAGNFVTTAIFFIDMSVCNVAYGYEAYWSTPSTCFDGIIASASVVELILARLAGSGSSGKSVMSVFRSLRLVRLFKMVKQWKSLHSLLNTMARAASDVRSFGILLSLFVFIYALVGMQMFANRLHFDKVTGAHIDIVDPKYASADVPRSNFDDFFWSATTVFQILSGENWNTVLYDCWKATPFAPAYFISLVVLGVFCALNLFLAILLLPFDGSELMASNRVYPQGEPLGEEQHPGPTYLKVVETLQRIKRKLLSHMYLGKSDSIRRVYELVKMRCAGFVEDRRFDSCLTCIIILSSITLALDDSLRNPTSPMSVGLLVLNCVFTSVFVLEFLIKLIAHGVPKYLQDRWNWIDFTAVVASILELASVKGGKTLRVLRAFRVLRPLKMINRFPEVKVVVDALLMSLPSVVDVGVVCALFFLVFSIFGVTFLKGAFYKCQESTLTPEELHLVTYPKLVGEMTATEFSWLDNISASCDASTWTAGKTPTSRELCECMDGDWVAVIPQNFNNVLSGFALLFEISTTESWVDVMYAAIDQRGIDMQPVQDHNRWWALFFVIYLVLGAFFVLELFVGVIIENFSRLREVKGQGIMTEAQRQWASTQQFVMRIRPELLLRRPENKARALCFDFVLHRWFDRFIVAIIIANSISIATVSFGDSDEKIQVLGALNFVFSSVYFVETVLKMVALGRRAYFRSKWNVFDFAVVCGVAIGFVLKLSITDQRLASSISSLVSLMRMGRLVKLIRLVKPLRAPFNTMLSVLPGMANIGALLLLLLLIYAVCGVQLYGTVAYQGDLSEQANFRSVGSAMLLLWRYSTGEGWPNMIYSLLEERDGCDPNPTYDEASPWCLDEDDYPDCKEVNGCGAGGSAYLYFYSFTMVVSFVILNMFVAVVLQAFEASGEGELLNPTDLEHFIQVWSEFDPEATWFLPVHRLQSFLFKLGPPLGVSGQSIREQGDLYPKDPCLLDIAVNEKKQVHIVNVASLLAKRIAKEKQGDDFGELNDDHPVQSRLLKRTFSSFDRTTSTTLGDTMSASQMIILRAVIRFKRRRRQAREEATIKSHPGLEHTSP